MRTHLTSSVACLRATARASRCCFWAFSCHRVWLLIIQAKSNQRSLQVQLLWLWCHWLQLRTSWRWSVLDWDYLLLLEARWSPIGVVSNINLQFSWDRRRWGASCWRGRTSWSARQSFFPLKRYTLAIFYNSLQWLLISGTFIQMVAHVASLIPFWNVRIGRMVEEGRMKFSI